MVRGIECNLWVWLVGVVARRYINFLILIQSCQIFLICEISPGFCLFSRISPELPLRHLDFPLLHDIS